MKRIVPYVGTALMAGWLYASLGLAHEDHSKHLPEAKDSIAFRTYLMENIGDNAEELNNKVKAGKIKAAKVNAQAIALHATRIPELFPKGSTSEKSRAKDEIWQKWDEFVKSAETLRTDVDQLAVMTADGTADAVGGQVKKVFGGCKSCHDSFRKPDKNEQKK
jgi:cytochrome c556